MPPGNTGCGEGVIISFFLVLERITPFVAVPVFYGCDEPGCKHKYSNPRSTIIDHFSPFTLDCAEVVKQS